MMDESFEKLKKAFVEVLKNPHDVDPCDYCKNKIICKSKKCRPPGQRPPGRGWWPHYPSNTS